LHFLAVGGVIVGEASIPTVDELLFLFLDLLHCITSHLSRFVVRIHFQVAFHARGWNEVLVIHPFHADLHFAAILGFDGSFNPSVNSLREFQLHSMMSVGALLSKTLDSLDIGIRPSDLLDSGALVLERAHNRFKQRVHVLLVFFIHDALRSILVSLCHLLLFIIDMGHLISSRVLIRKVLCLSLEQLFCLRQFFDRPLLVLLTFLQQIKEIADLSDNERSLGFIVILNHCL